MLMFNLTNYFSGIIKLELSGMFPEKFINLCISQDIYLWGITKEKDFFYVYMRLPDFYKIRRLSRQSRTRVKVVAHYGLPFAKKRIIRRKMLIIGAILSIVILNVMASYIWFIDVTGTQNMPIDKIKIIARENGLKPGALKSSVNIKKLEREILYNAPELTWVAITFTGTRAVIEVVEKTLPPREDKSPANIVADKPGIISEIIVLAGEAAVKAGDTVKKGDLLIKQPAISANTIRAKGLVKARVWYEGYGEANIIEKKYQRTGRQKTAITVNVGGYCFPIKFINGEPFDAYEIQEVQKKLPMWRNESIPVESNIKIYHELEVVVSELTLEQAKDKAKAQALLAVQEILPKDIQILSRNIVFLPSDEKKIIRVKASIETVEDIGKIVNTE